VDALNAGLKCNDVTKPTRSTQPCIPPGSLNRVPALIPDNLGLYFTFYYTANQEWTRDWVTDYRMFEILDSLKSTSTGLDGLPAWFLRLCAPVFCKTLADLINLSVSTSVVPMQWKQAKICPVPKTSGPSSQVTSAQFPLLQFCQVSLRRVLCVIFCIQPSTVCCLC